MKLLPLGILLFILNINLYAQPQKGNLLLGGGFGYSDFEEDVSSIFNEKITQFRFNPSFNFYLGKDVTLGLNFTYQNTINSSTETNPSNSQQGRFKSTIKTYNIGPVVSFQPQIVKGLHFKGDVGFNIGFGNGEYRNGGNNYESTINSLSFRVSPGLLYFISKGIAIAGNFGGIVYENFEENLEFPTNNAFGNTEEEITSSNVGFDFNSSSFTLSLFFLLGNKDSGSK